MKKYIVNTVGCLFLAIGGLWAADCFVTDCGPCAPEGEECTTKCESCHEFFTGKISDVSLHTWVELAGENVDGYSSKYNTQRCKWKCKGNCQADYCNYFNEKEVEGAINQEIDYESATCTGTGG